MKKYMVFLNGQSPEIIEADRFEVESFGLRLIKGNDAIAAFYSWIGIKEMIERGTFTTSVTTTSTGASQAAQGAGELGKRS